MMLALYRGVTDLAGPLLYGFLLWRRRRGKEDRARLGERLGHAGLLRPHGIVVWLHAASVGEAISMLPVIARLQQRPGHTVLLTTGTVTSAALMAERLPSGALHQFVPVDRLRWVRRFLDHWRPDLALWAESEFWPNLLIETAARGTPVILLNGRVSARSFVGWQRFPASIRRLLGSFVMCLGQTDEDASRLARLGAVRTACLGNLKFSAPALSVDDAALRDMLSAFGSRPCWLAVSTHAGEEALVGRVHKLLSPRFPSLLSVIVPRHPVRGVAIDRDLTAAGLRVARRSAGQPVLPDTEIYLADSLGELGLFIRLAPLVLIGKSLIGQGGQNPLEPARLGAAVLFGPHMGNFAEIAARMRQAGAATEIADEAALAAALSARLADPALVRAEGSLALAFATAEDGVLDAVIGAIDQWMPASAPPSV